jgi:hypothetical protein
VQQRFSENRDVYETMRKNVMESQAKNDSTRRHKRWVSTATRAHACTPPAHPPPPPHTHTHKYKCVTHSFSTATMVSRTRLDIMLYVYYVFCVHIVSNSIKLPSSLFTQKAAPDSIMLFQTSPHRTLILYYFMTTEEMKSVCPRHAPSSTET